MASHWEDMLAFQVHAVKLPAPTREFRLLVDRRWRFDFAWLPQKILVEVHGGTGTFVQGRHVRGAHVTPEGFEKDREKINSAVLEGFRVLEFTGKQIKTGLAIGMIEKALAK